ncbi:MAG: hypothetical protein ACRDNB_02900 [Gaiellaceae bacterium]
MQLETDRLVLRSVTEDDVDVVLARRRQRAGFRKIDELYELTAERLALPS